MSEGNIALAAYGLSLLADPCLIVSAAVAGTIGGRAIAWGVAFGFMHFLFGTLGLSFSSHFLAHSEITAHIIALLLIALFFAHTARHADSHDCCNCDGEPKKRWSKGGLLLGALLGVGFHAAGVGVVLQVAGSELGYNTLVAALGFGSLFLGLFVGLIVNQHDALAREARRAVKWMPGVVTAILILLFATLALGVLEHLDAQLEVNMNSLHLGIAAVALVMGIFVQIRSSKHHHEGENHNA